MFPQIMCTDGINYGLLQLKKKRNQVDTSTYTHVIVDTHDTPH